MNAFRHTEAIIEVENAEDLFAAVARLLREPGDLGQPARRVVLDQQGVPLSMLMRSWFILKENSKMRTTNEHERTRIKSLAAKAARAQKHIRHSSCPSFIRVHSCSFVA